MFSSRLTLQGDSFSSDTAIGLPQTGGKGHQKLARRVLAGRVPLPPQKKSASTGMLAQLKSAAGKGSIEY
jgi:hypothetical protein